MVARASALSSRAFTLIELLVVIAIIAILAGLLLPALGRANGHDNLTAAAMKITGKWTPTQRSEGKMPLNHGSTYVPIRPVGTRARMNRPSWTAQGSRIESTASFRVCRRNH